MDRQTHHRPANLGTGLVAGCVAGIVGLCVLAPPGQAQATATAPEIADVQIDSMFVRYEANSGRGFEQPLGIAIDTFNDEIVIANTGLSRIEYFDRAGHPRGFFVHRVPAAGGATREGLPKQVAIDGRGRLLVSDALAPFVDICDYRGRSIGRITLPAPDDRLDEGNGPGAIGIASAGRILVASRGKQGRVHVLDADGKWLETWGVTGAAPGQLSVITGMAITPQGEVFITCIATDLGVQVFDAKGKYLRGWGEHDIGPGRFSQPAGIVVTPDARVWVTDTVRNNMQVFDVTGKLMGTTGGEGPGSWFYPGALASDGKGGLALVEMGGKRFRVMWVR